MMTHGQQQTTKWLYLENVTIANRAESVCSFFTLHHIPDGEENNLDIK